MLRRDIVQSLFDSTGRGLEVGPSHAPIFPRALGFDVEILDYEAAAGLRSRYAAMGIDTSAIEEVDYISDGRPMHEVIGDARRYDYIFSSHAIEHVPDVVGFFKSAEILLKPGGSLVFAIPDKRYTFDAYQMPSTTGDVIQAYLEKRTRHAAARIFDFFASTAYLDRKEPTWSLYAHGAVELMGTPVNAHALTLKALADLNTYTDVHGWYFTPSSLRLIMHDLNEIGLISLKEANMVESGNFEFYAVYSERGAGCGIDRAELIRRVIRDQTLSGLQILSSLNGDSDLWQTLQLATS